MSLQAYIDAWFDGRTQMLADRLTPLVHVLATSTPERVSAWITGQSAIRVTLAKVHEGLRVRCTCPPFLFHGVHCEHLCAVMKRLGAAHLELARAIAGDTPAGRVPALDEGELLWERTERRLQELAGAGAPHPASLQQICYLLTLDPTEGQRELTVTIGLRRQRQAGSYTDPKETKASRRELVHHATEEDRALLDRLFGKERPSLAHDYGGLLGAPAFSLSSSWDRELVRSLCATGRCFEQQGRATVPLAWSDEAVRLDVRFTRDESRARFEVRLRRGEHVLEPKAERFLGAGVVLLGSVFHPFDDLRAGKVGLHLLEARTLEAPLARAPDLVARLLAVPGCPLPELPPDLLFQEIRTEPTPELAFSHDAEQRLVGELAFWYQEIRVEADAADAALVDTEKRIRIVRVPEAEARAAGRLRELGVKPEGERWSVTKRAFFAVTRALLAEGWRVLADKLKVVPSSGFDIKVSSGIDWFDVDGACDFGGAPVSIRRLLHAAQREQGFVPLGNGKVGILPEDWIEKHKSLLALGEKNEGGEGLRFRRSQALLLDALLAERQGVVVDAGFTRLRERVTGFTKVEPREPERTFRGTLRPYQKEALGWFSFLRELGLSGCLADDMGLGKTVQVLALLEERRATSPAGKRRTSLVVAPRSLVFHWRKEALRFVPKLSVLDCSGVERTRDREEVLAHDLVLVTYGTLRRDIAWLAEIVFDYAILDESTAIKNEESQAAKASRLLRAEHRLALSGTPLENHLGELWSLFEYLNPGMLGASSALQKLARTSGGEQDSRQALARMLRPFLLRRTKAQVAKDLPERVEETLWCELGEEQRRFYDGVRDAARELILGAVAAKGVAGAMPNVLTGLLRLRQAACHPRLIASRGAPSESAKLDELMERITQVREEGNKALVFSQFTSLLGLVRERLDADHVVYEYLDGKTRNREAHVERFQEDPECELFLISLKAGGLGLNLTAASYVFLLDPWWNPAIEAQAIDRTHRIGQTQRVIAYRLIAKDTVEERILELQAKKRELADAILGGEGGPLSRLTREDLEQLLS